jgi:hypothetical protein
VPTDFVGLLVGPFVGATGPVAQDIGRPAAALWKHGILDSVISSRN